MFFEIILLKSEYMKKLFLLFVMVCGLYGGAINTTIQSVDGDVATAKVDKIDVGVSGFVVHKLDKNNSSIIKNATVIAFDKVKKVAYLKLSPFKLLKNNALPKGKWQVKVGDKVVLAFGYTRGLLIAPTEDIYYRITKNSKQVQWLHPDIFATLLSYNGHPTPLKEDFDAMCATTSIGLIYFYLNKNLYTVDAKSFKVLNIAKAPFEQEELKLPFYTRVKEINANWWGAGSNRMKTYAPHYYSLLIEHNRDNGALFDSIKNGDPKFHGFLLEFDISSAK